MNMPLPTHEAPEGSDDLRALAWVQDEVRRSLEAAHKALRRQLKEADALAGSDVDNVDPSVLRGARTQLHQAAGALEIVGLAVPAKVVRACETATQRMAARPAQVTARAVETIEHASFAVLDFLSRLVAGKPVAGVLLFPQYRAVQELAGADRAHPADLWERDWRWHDLPAEAGVAPRAADAAARGAMEQLMLRLMRAPDRTTLRRMSDLCASLAAAHTGRPATMWQLAAAVFEAQAADLLRADVFVKRIVSRVLAQMRAGDHPADVSERLAHDLLFFCARAEAPSELHPAPRLDGVRNGYGLVRDRQLPDYESSHLGRFDPASIAQARKRVGAARDAWSAVAGGDMHRIGALTDVFALVGESLRRLYPEGDVLARALAGAATQTAQAAEPPPPSLAMEVATSVLYLEASLEDTELDHPELAARIQRMAQRIDESRRGASPQPLDPWMEELYRRVSDRQTMGSVVQELRASLSEIEKQIDQYFRNSAQREVLYPVPGQLSSMRGVLSVLGLDQASQAVLRMRDEVDALAQTEVDPQQAIGAGTFDRLADNLGALSFLIDMLGVQPHLAKSLFRYDAEAGSLRALMGQVARVPAFADSAHGPGAGLDTRAGELARDAQRTDVPDDVLAGRLGRLAQQATLAEQPALARSMAAAQAALARATDVGERRALRSDLAQALQERSGRPPVPAPAPTPLPGDDSEMREVFLEEAGEVMQEAQQALAHLGAPARDLRGDLEELTVLRRAFHTLKGSSRMVGLGDFGEAAWACEQLFNARLAQGAAADVPLRTLTGEALAYLAGWIDAIAAARDGGHRPAPVVAAAEALRIEGRLVPIAVPQAAPAPLSAAVPGLPSAAELELPQRPGIEEPPPATAAPEFALEPPGLPMPHWEPERADIGMAATLPMPPRLPADEPAAPPTIERIRLDLSSPDQTPVAPPAAPVGEVPPAPALVVHDEPVLAPSDAEQYKVIGPLRIDIPMFNIYLNEADELSRRLGTELAEWATALAGPPGDAAVALAHSLAGSSGTVGFADLSTLARALEHALMRSNESNRLSAGEPALYTEAADEIRRLLHQFAAGFLKPVMPGLVDRLEQHQPEPMPSRFQPPEELAVEPAETAHGFAAVSASMPLEPLDEAREPELLAVPPADAFDDDEDIDAVDAVDPELFPIFSEEALELLPQLQSRMRDWVGRPTDPAAAAACMRTLHTFKGGARLAGAMRLGEMAHRLETAVEHQLARGDTRPADVEPLLARVDAIEGAFGQMVATPVAAERPPAAALVPELPVAAPQPAAQPAQAFAPEPVPSPAAAARLPGEAPPVDWSRFAAAGPAEPAAPERPASIATAGVRVRAALLDRLVNQSGEVSIARARIESDVGRLRSSVSDLTENLERMRSHLRGLELQAESQISSRMEAAKAAAVDFDPLEMDRYTRFQELTRMMAESVNDVATVQRGLQRTLQSTEDELAAQARLTRSLQDDLLRTRMVEFEALSDRLYRVVRQAAKETGKQVRLDIVGGSVEIDRGVLDRMTAPFEHLLRNSVTHGIEPPGARAAAGKDATGTVLITLHQEGNEVAVEFRDDGAGLDLPRIRERAIAAGLLDPAAQPSDAELVDFVFTPGFSTAQAVTELSGRGVGMDVVRSEVVAMGGRVETASTPGQGTRFRLVLPLTTAVTQVVLLRCGRMSVAVPSPLVEVVRRVRADDIVPAYASGEWALGDQTMPFFWLGALLDGDARGVAAGRSVPVVVIRSAAQRVALHVDEVLGNQEVVVKNLGPQLARLPGLAGMTLLPSGTVSPIYNPVALSVLYGDAVRERARRAGDAADAARVAATQAPAPVAPLVLVVDDSLTVRRVTQRLLEREGYRVVTAKDGLDAIERLAEEKPAVVLSDIEMPRMDGFDFVRNLRADARVADLPVIMITSRIAQKHRDYARELGVNHYLGKPYGEDELLALVARYARRQPSAVPV